MQINAAYVADRIMDVFLKTSGLHPELSRRLARLGLFLAWRMNLEGAKAFSSNLVEWLDSLQEWRGWSDSEAGSRKCFLISSTPWSLRFRAVSSRGRCLRSRTFAANGKRVQTGATVRLAN
ncbi:hypothetical protein [Marinobacter sp. F4218]|uniref:hypothetical protein n=1 Tax=Marinobacter sp. F4218 TaxID=2862868 RepID=UPI001E2AED51|nr:hypothetical protein [Marinobacter sp. F4218]